MRGVETEDIINKLFNTFCKRYQEGLETITHRGYTVLKVLLEFVIAKMA